MMAYETKLASALMAYFHERVLLLE